MTLVRPLPLPDELALGYMGRVGRYNGLAHPREVGLCLLDWSGNAGKSRRQVTTVELLAQAAGLDTCRFVQDHTALPLRRAVAFASTELPHGSPSNAGLLQTMPLRALRPNAYFCPRCVQEDIDFHGTPYWRRSHQLPGVFSCPKHGVPLKFTNADNPFWASPTSFGQNSETVAACWARRIRECELIQRFHAIGEHWLTRTHPLAEDFVSKLARRTAHALGIHVGRGTIKQKLLSDLLREQIDPSWIDTVVPGLSSQPSGVFWQPVDGALQGRNCSVTSIVYQLVFAALFESSDAAIQAMETRVATTADRASNQESGRTDFDQELRKAYITHDGCHSSVTQSLGVSRERVRAALCQLGLPAIGKGNQQAINRVIELVLNGDLSLKQACESAGVSVGLGKNTLNTALRPCQDALAAMLKPRRRQPSMRPRPKAPPRQMNHIEAEVNIRFESDSVKA